MSKAIGGGGGSSDLILVAVIIVGAMIYSRSAGAGALAGRPRVVSMPTTASGATGNGTQQVTAGVTAGLASWLANMARGSINTNPGNGYDTWNGTATVQNSFGLYGPIGGTAEDPWYG